MDACSECGFVYEELPLGDVPERLASFGPRYRARLVNPGPPASPRAGLRNRPDVDVWTGLEYACHVRDLLELQRERLGLALGEDCPVYAPMGREERVVTGRYNQQAPLEVADAIDTAAVAIAQAFARLEPAQWDRTAIYNWPTPTERTMAWLGRHTVHEGEHHLDDIDRLLGGPPTGQG